MKKKAKAKSPMLAAVLEGARDLHTLGFIDKRRMREYESLCLPEIPAYDSDRIKALRKHLKVSQTVLASLLNTSPSTVRKWEIGEKRPSGPSLKLLDLLQRKGINAVL